MPFTFSHPALVLPIYLYRKRYFSLTGLVIGSITPDFEYFIRMKKGMSVYSHTFSALFWFNLPVALFLAFLFHTIIKKPLIHNLPQWLFIRFAKYENFEWLTYFKRNWLIVLFSILLGAASHLWWDWFTHYSVDNAIGNRRMELNFIYWDFKIYTYTLFHILNSVVGLAALFIFIVQLPFHNGPEKTFKDKWYWVKVIVISSVIIMRFAYAPYLSIDDLAAATISAILLAITFTSFLSKYNKRSVY